MFNNREVVFKNSFRLKFYSFALLTAAAVTLSGFFSSSMCQWSNDPASNTRLVIEAADPIDISAVKDLHGGAFLFWQDTKIRFQGRIYFMHVDADGKISFRADGKTVSDLPGASENPVSCGSLPGSAVVVWKDVDTSSGLYAQRVQDNGSLLWSDEGVKISGDEETIGSYSTAADDKGNCFISFVTKSTERAGYYSLHVQKLTAGGKKIFSSDSTAVYKSANRISMPLVAPYNGGAFVFWLENKLNKTIILGQRIDTAAASLWGIKPVEVSPADQSVISYSITGKGLPGIYLVWQTQGADKNIYDQMVGPGGRLLWKTEGKLMTDMEGSQSNPQAVSSDSSITVTWTNDINGDRDIYIQKFNTQGNPMWSAEGLPVIKYSGEQFGQKIISDGSGGSIVAWIDRRTDSTYADIYAQKISGDGKVMWDSLGVPAASNFNTPKSYLSLLTDGRSNALIMFKNVRDGKSGIFGQKIFSTGTYISQILDFNTFLEGDSVRISWHSANERNNTSYTIERTVQADTGFSNWTPIKTFRSTGISRDSEYEFYDYPNTPGTLYYRIAQNEPGKNPEFSSVARVNYFGSASGIVVAQNSPNPFSDSTVISFYLPKSEKVTFEFFDSHIELVHKISGESFPAGENRITFSAEGLKPGIYFYRFKSEDFVEVKKMVITN